MANDRSRGDLLSEPPSSSGRCNGEYDVPRKSMLGRFAVPFVAGVIGSFSVVFLPHDPTSATEKTGGQQVVHGLPERQISGEKVEAFRQLEDACYANPTVIATGAEIHIPPSSDSVRVMGAGARVILDEGVVAGDVTVCGARARILLEDSSTAGTVAIFGAGVEAHIRPGAEATKVIAEGSNATVFAGTTDIQLVVNGDGSGVSPIG